QRLRPYDSGDKAEVGSIHRERGKVLTQIDFSKKTQNGPPGAKIGVARVYFLSLQPRNMYAILHPTDFLYLFPKNSVPFLGSQAPLYFWYSQPATWCRQSLNPGRHSTCPSSAPAKPAPNHARTCPRPPSALRRRNSNWSRLSAAARNRHFRASSPPITRH